MQSTKEVVAQSIPQFVSIDDSEDSGLKGHLASTNEVVVGPGRSGPIRIIANGTDVRYYFTPAENDAVRFLFRFSADTIVYSSCYPKLRKQTTAYIFRHISFSSSKVFKLIYNYFNIEDLLPEKQRSSYRISKFECYNIAFPPDAAIENRELFNRTAFKFCENDFFSFLQVSVITGDDGLVPEFEIDCGCSAESGRCTHVVDTLLKNDLAESYQVSQPITIQCDHCNLPSLTLELKMKPAAGGDSYQVPSCERTTNIFLFRINIKNFQPAIKFSSKSTMYIHGF